MTSQAAVAHSSAKKGKKWRKKNKNYQKEKHPLAPAPKGLLNNSFGTILVENSGQLVF